MVATIGALMVDLTGQIGVYAFGPQVHTGLGGHLGFALGAFLAKRGRYVTVLPSIVSIPREIADTVVTDHGVARLLGKSVRERVEAMIQIAHPDFRDELRSVARKTYW